jgi:hypothetical protein
MLAFVIPTCFVSQINSSVYIIKRNVAELGKSDAVVTIDCNIRPRLDQRVCVLLVWKRAERPGKYRNVHLSDIF